MTITVYNGRDHNSIVNNGISRNIVLFSLCRMLASVFVWPYPVSVSLQTMFYYLTVNKHLIVLQCTLSSDETCLRSFYAVKMAITRKD